MRIAAYALVMLLAVSGASAIGYQDAVRQMERMIVAQGISQEYFSAHFGRVPNSTAASQGENWTSFETRWLVQADGYALVYTGRASRQCPGCAVNYSLSTDSLRELPPLLPMSELPAIGSGCMDVAPTTRTAFTRQGDPAIIANGTLRGEPRIATIRLDTGTIECATPTAADAHASNSSRPRATPAQKRTHPLIVASVAGLLVFLLVLHYVQGRKRR